ncbi:MAG TPA: PIN domain-containing protein [Candidatus Binatia bacterium]|nr:PIN domain-containing protein [Candidatus Binatia bacterium]
MSGPRCVLDASAVLAWLFRERGEQLVDRMLEHGALSTVNLAEVLYRSDEAGMEIEGLEQDLKALGLRVVSFTDGDARLVPEIRRAARRERQRLSLADCCCLAMGVRLNLPVVGGDQAWESLQLGVDVHPIR